MSKKKFRSAIGGQAVLEGVMMRGECSMATAVRDEKGEIQIESSRFTPAKEKSKWKRLPFIRGVINFVNSMIMGVQIIMRSSEVFEGEAEPTKFETWCSKKFNINLMSVVMWFAVLLGLALAIGLFFVIPHFAIEGIRALVVNVCHSSMPEFCYNLIEGVIRILIFVLYILLTSLMKEIKRVFRYHGAEHKTISCFEHGLELTVENVQKQSTIHDRCGTTFMFLVMIVSVALFSVVGIVPNNIVTSKIGAMFIKLLIKLALLPIVAGISYEILKFLAKFDNWFVKIIKAPGLLLQKITTAEPDDSMVEVAIAAFQAVQILDSDPTAPTTKFKTKILIEKGLQELNNALKIDTNGNADRDWIICEVLKINRSEIANLKFFWSDDFERMLELATERGTGKPLQQVFGYTDFYGMKINVDCNVLCPRPETEYLVEEVSKLIKENAFTNVLDLCTGSGAIALVLKRDNPQINITASDISEKALMVAEGNAEQNELDVKFVVSNLFDKIDGKFDVIVSNPPYIKKDVIPTLSPEVRFFEPSIALDGGIDGLDFYRKIVNNAKNHLKIGGILAFEIGFDQKDSVFEILENCENAVFEDIICGQDLEGNDRMIFARLAKINDSNQNEKEQIESQNA